PVFNIPGGTVKAAIGGTFTSFHFNTVTMDNTGAPSLIVPYQMDPESRQVWAAFTQVNIPVFSESNAIPFFRRLEFEASWRHDQYSDVKGTSNPKIAFNWSPIDDLTIRGAWAIPSARLCLAKFHRSPMLRSPDGISAISRCRQLRFRPAVRLASTCRPSDRARGKSPARSATACREVQQRVLPQALHP